MFDKKTGFEKRFLDLHYTLVLLLNVR